VKAFSLYILSRGVIDKPDGTTRSGWLAIDTVQAPSRRQAVKQFSPEGRGNWRVREGHSSRILAYPA